MSDPKPILTRDPPVAVKEILIRLTEATGVADPNHILDACVNHLGMVAAIIAKQQGKSRGELKAMIRKAFKDCEVMALGNYGQVVEPAKTGGVH